jgi:hypothetical protein
MIVFLSMDPGEMKIFRCQLHNSYIFFLRIAAGGVGDSAFSVQEVMQGVPQNDSRLLKYIHLHQVYSPVLKSNNNHDADKIGNFSETVQNVKDPVTRDVIKFLQKKVGSRSNIIYMQAYLFQCIFSIFYKSSTKTIKQQGWRIFYGMSSIRRKSVTFQNSCPRNVL